MLPTLVFRYPIDPHRHFYNPTCLEHLPLPCILNITTISINSVPRALFGLGTCYKTKTTLDDGTVVRVKRPFIGLKSHENLVGLTGRYKVRIDGWRCEKALIRIWSRFKCNDFIYGSATGDAGMRILRKSRAAIIVTYATICKLSRRWSFDLMRVALGPNTLSIAYSIPGNTVTISEPVL